jgi:tripartite-type tricarboxylate transporter receptor subunit TctC
MKKILTASAVAAALLLQPTLASSETFPSRQGRIIVTFAPGGNADTIARLVADSLTRSLGQTVIVDNRPGGATIVGTNAVIQAPPDGYTMLEASTSISTNPPLGNATPYDAEKDLVPVATLVTIPAVLVVNKTLPVKNLAEFIAYAKAHPSQLNYGSAGNGSFPHLAMEQLGQQQGIKMTHVPFKGFGPAMLGLLRNDANVLASDIPGALPHIKSGELRALAVTSKARMSMLPDVPTAEEAGAKGYEAIGFLGIMVRSGTPREIVEILNRDIDAALKSPKTAEYIASNGLIAGGGTPDEFGAFLKRDKEIWSKVIAAGNIRGQ